ncbi:5-formyltetrahydrofolate cyclo-ligase [Sandaracinobacteroides saxicola]|uniref:5-formyltetrahydrofolate cyclo-ligase n=1 Tax=Sandaracinobacteroides saxicola TaxID=2759707 RepID=A0A7G5IK70_9SPHN|nr:5-formyltetrahydrofolate cyclo-ligase [Sandaracinobacteroides saxicola]QMW23762.1 5-formyltetrahydrofolate cyclo-ligase [Sandaracinobacteroides saxicola]
MIPRADVRRAMRARCAAYVRALTAGERAEQAQALADLVAPALPRRGVFASYAPMGDEIDTAPLEALALERGMTLAFPKVRGTAPLSFHRCRRDQLIPGFKRIPEPPADAHPVRPDVALVPLIAADRFGNRLGQGAGHWDRTLAWLRAQSGPGVLAIGIGWDMQRVSHVAAEQWDQPLDALATPTRFQFCLR